MIRRPRLDDHLVIGLYTGKIVVVVGLLMAVPLALSLVLAEWDTALDFVISMSASLAFGFGLQILCRTDKDPGWSHGLVIASGSWIIASVLGGLPHWLSGHIGSYVDAVFDAMSGYTTTGLFLIQDLDHISYGLNMWRFMLTYAGGQGIIVVALTFLFKGTAGAYKLYVGEGKEERLLPNVIQTARAIWLVSLAYLVLGSVVFIGLGLALGQTTLRSVLFGTWFFMSGWSTGGFAPISYNTFYFHSLAYEIAAIVVFTAGSFNFALHWAVWTGNRREIVRNVETVSFAVTLTATVALATFWLGRIGLYSNTMSLFRKAFYQIVSGHTTTGFGTLYARSFVTQWGTLGMLATIVAMTIGASAASTAGGIKGIRIGVISKSFFQEIRRLISPESSVNVEKLHHVRDIVLGDKMVRAAMAVTIAYVSMYALMSVVGAAFGYPLVEAIFEGVSVTANVGLSCGVTAPTMPGSYKGLFIVAMWLGRLEYMSVFALAGYAYAMVRGR